LQSDSNESRESEIHDVWRQVFNWPLLIQNDKLRFTILKARRFRELRDANHFFVVLEDVVLVSTCQQVEDNKKSHELITTSTRTRQIISLHAVGIIGSKKLPRLITTAVDGSLENPSFWDRRFR
jgi:hypothetical protein